MIVDDDKMLCKSLNLALKHIYALVIVPNAELALKKLHTIKCDLMLIDIHLPGMDGIELLKIVKDTYPLIKIIIFTAYPALDTYRAILKGDADDYLEKPVEPDTLITTIDELLDMKETSLFAKVCAYIKSHLDEPITLETVSQRFHKTPKNFSRWFNRICRLSGAEETFSTFVIKQRMEYAKELLRETDLFVKEVSWEVGYNSVQSFYYTFKQLTGLTAEEFRKKYNYVYRSKSKSSKKIHLKNARNKVKK